MTMEGAAGPWGRLAVDDGDRALVEGTLLRLPQGWCVAPDGARVVANAGAAVSAWPSIDVEPPKTLPDMGSLDRRRVRLEGTWHHRRLAVDTVDSCAPATGPLDLDPEDPLDLNREDPLDVLPYRPGRPLVSSETAFAAWSSTPGRRLPLPQVPDAERALLDAGVLQRAVGPARGDGRPVAVVASPGDQEVVQAALADLHGPDLQIVVAPWGRDTVDALLDVVTQDESLVHSVGESVGEDQARRVTATLLHLPTALATRLAAFPTDALVLEVLVNPAPGPAGGSAAERPDGGRPRPVGLPWEDGSASARPGRT